MILKRLGGGDEAYFTYVEEADNDANKNSALIQTWYYLILGGGTHTRLMPSLSEMASIGQKRAQTPHPMQYFSSRFALSSVILIASTGQRVSHSPQPVHSSSSITER